MDMEHLITEQQFSCVIAWISSSSKICFPFFNPWGIMDMEHPITEGLFKVC
jgi:hypothetical protein